MRRLTAADPGWPPQVQLSAELASRCLPKTGLKADLAQRLFDAIKAEGGGNVVTGLPVESDESAPR